MKVVPLASVFLLVASSAGAQSSPEDNDKRPVQAHFYELTPLKAGPDFSASLKVPRGYRAAVWASDLGNTRVMAVAPDGSIYVSRRSEADVVRLPQIAPTRSNLSGSTLSTCGWTRPASTRSQLADG